MAGTTPRTERHTREVNTDLDQEYFWSEEWQAGEEEASAQLDAGEGEVFLEGRHMLRALDHKRAARDGI